MTLEIQLLTCDRFKRRGRGSETVDGISTPTNKIDRHDIAEIQMKVALNTINQTKPCCFTTLSNSIFQ
jgi:hypothetical protein